MPKLPLVLIIDDTPENIMVLGATLDKICRVRFATSGQEGLDVISKEQPDLVLLDVMMPEMNGYEVFAMMKSDPQSDAIPVIFVTAHADANSESEALLAGAADFIHKPINPEVVRSRVITQLQLVHNRKHLENLVLERTQDLAIARREAETAQAVVTRFMKNVSHEMNTPMHGILGFAELGRMKLGKIPESDIADFFDKILQAGKRMNALLQSLLQVAQATWDEMMAIDQDALEWIAPETLINECILSLKQTADRRGQRIVLANEATATRIELDSTRMRRVLEALIANALRYSEDAATVHVLINDDPPSQAMTSRTMLRIQVIDEGCGIPDKELDAIFEPFYESTRTATGGGGTGLGLSLCKSIIKRHQGKLIVRNRQEGGAIFEILLPETQTTVAR